MASLYTLILQEVEDELEEITELLSPSIYRRKHPRLTERDELPAIIICPGVEVEFEQHSENTIQFLYPVYITMWFPSNAGLTENMEAMLDWREYIRQKFHRANPLTDLSPAVKPSAPWVIDCEVVLSTHFPPEVFNVGYDVSELQLLFLSEEARQS